MKESDTDTCALSLFRLEWKVIIQTQLIPISGPEVLFQDLRRDEIRG